MPHETNPHGSSVAQKFCLLLYESLGETRFIEGAFVCSDPLGSLHKLLCISSYPRLIAATHRPYLKRPEVVIRGHESVQREVLFETPILPHGVNVGGHCGTEFMRLVLFYSFRAVLPDGSIPRYTYLKMQRWPYSNPRHAVEAFQSYVIGTPCCLEEPIRCEMERYGCFETDMRYMKKMGEKSFQEFREFTNYVRNGNEVFVPSTTVDALLAHALVP